LPADRVEALSAKKRHEPVLGHLAARARASANLLARRATTLTQRAIDAVPSAP
jgi:hypothetical protein